MNDETSYLILEVSFIMAAKAEILVEAGKS